MTRNEYLSALRAELKRRGADDIEDILAEYAEHFACKLADGYSEEEIAARLGEPAQIAAQFDTARGEARGGGRGAQRASRTYWCSRCSACSGAGWRCSPAGPSPAPCWRWPC